TVTLRCVAAGLAQSMSSAATVTVGPVELARGCSMPNTLRFEHVSEPYAFIRNPVKVLPARDDLASPPARMRLRIWLHVRCRLEAASSAASPVTWGADMEVPDR